MNETVESMTSVPEFLKTRRSVSAAFLEEPGPDESQLAEILTIASRVPDHGKLVPWRFIIFRGEARHQAGEALARLYAERNPDAEEARLAEQRNLLARAPLVVAVVSRAAPHVKIPEVEQLLSAGAAAMNVVHAAHALGFAAQWVTGWVAYDAAARAVLGLRSTEQLAGIIHIGSSQLPATDRARPQLSDIVSEWKPA